MDCVPPTSVHQWPLDAVACDPLFMLACAMLMTPSTQQAQYTQILLANLRQLWTDYGQLAEVHLAITIQF